MRPRTKGGTSEDRVPGFGTWPRIYGAVVLNALVVMALLYVFSRWRF